jgi:hypothetical protein
MFPKRFKHRFLKPAGDEGSDTGGTEVLDRGDAWTPTEEPEVKAAPKPEVKGEPAPKDDPAPKDETEAKEEKGDRGRIIPLDRHEKILAREREQRQALEKQLQGMQGQARVATTNEQLTAMEVKVGEMEAKYTTLVADGETKEAAKLMRDIRAAERSIIETQAEFRSQATMSIAIEQMRYDTALERVEAAYGTLNPDHDDYDEEKMQEVADFKSVFQGRGDTATKALQKAVERVMGKAETAAQEKATTVAPRVTEDDLAKQRKVEAVKNTADAARRTPPATARIGQDSDKLGGGLNAKDVMNLSQDEFAKLSDEALSRMRGDTL